MSRVHRVTLTEWELARYPRALLAAVNVGAPVVFVVVAPEDAAVVKAIADKSFLTAEYSKQHEGWVIRT